jgi:hypothetical protein
MEDKKIICKVWKNKSNGQKLVTIPKDCAINEGEYVNIQKINFPSLESPKNDPTSV